jgi:mannitol-1-phosphate/altronate dehydrogenase
VASNNSDSVLTVSLADPLAKRLVSYDRASANTGIVHIGVGNFHRAHQALYADEILASGGVEWGICGISLMPNDRELFAALQRQNGLYTLIERQNDSRNVRVIGSLLQLIPAYELPEIAFLRLTNEGTRIVSLTITERGYCHDPQTKQIDINRPEIAHDIDNPTHPVSAAGYLVEALHRRRSAGLVPFTVLSCDNIPLNGDTLRNVVLALAQARSPKLAEWIANFGAFPNSMVDRITPAYSPETKQWVKDQFGIIDEAPVVAEPFRQWVIEDKFCSGRPDWDRFGANFVENVHPYELAKIRLLNVSHSALAYPGLFAGLTFVHEAVRDPDIHQFVRALMDDEITPTLPILQGFDYCVYKTSLIERFSNNAIGDRLERICSDGSQKLANQLLPIIRDRLAARMPYRRLAFVVAAWLRYLAGKTDNGETYKVIDPLADRLTASAASARDSIEPYLAAREIFPQDLSSNPQFKDEVSSALRHLYADGWRAAIQDFI